MLNYLILICLILSAALGVVAGLLTTAAMIASLAGKDSLPPFAIDHPERLHYAICLLGVATILFSWGVYTAYNYILQNAPHIFVEFGIWYAIGAVSVIWVDFIFDDGGWGVEQMLLLVVCVGVFGPLVTIYGIMLHIERHSKK